MRFFNRCTIFSDRSGRLEMINLHNSMTIQFGGGLWWVPNEVIPVHRYIQASVWDDVFSTNGRRWFELNTLRLVIEGEATR